VLDALLFEERGVPGIAVVTTPFLQTGAAMATTWGLPGFRFLDTPHPIATLTGEELDQRAAAMAPLVIDLLRA
jgi:hypothetical protein